MTQLGSPTEAGKQYFMEMRRLMLDTNPGLPLEMAPGMRNKSKKKTKSKSKTKSKTKSKKKSKSKSKSKTKSKSKSKTKSKSKKKSKSKSKSKKTITKREFLQDLFRRAKKELPFMKNRKDRLEYINKLKSIPNKDLKKMTRPIQVINYMPQAPSQNLGYSAADLGETLVRQKAFNPKKTVYEGSRM
jgi:hypothetical protein